MDTRVDLCARCITDTIAGYAPEKIQYGIDRYTNETRRLYRTLDNHLKEAKSSYIVGDRCTIADISCWGWISSSSKPYPLPSPSPPPPPPPLHPMTALSLTRGK